MRIIIGRRSNDYIARATVKGRQIWSCGNSADEAIGSLVRTHPGHFRVDISFPNETEESRKHDPNVVPRWVKDLVQEVTGGSPVEIGDVVIHPSGRKVRITNGRYWGDHGISNHWEWREVMANGELSPTVESGYIRDDWKDLRR